MVWPLKRHPAYTSLVNEAGYVDGTRVKQKVQPSSSWRPTLIVVLLLITIATSFYAGQVSVQSRMLSLHIPRMYGNLVNTSHYLLTVESGP